MHKCNKCGNPANFSFRRGPKEDFIDWCRECYRTWYENETTDEGCSFIDMEKDATRIVDKFMKTKAKH